MSAAKLLADPVEKWLGSVAYSHSGSKDTENNYRKHFGRFLSFTGKTAKEILSEYEALEDFKDARRFRDKFADQIMSWIIVLREGGLEDTTIRTMVGAVQSFLKYTRIQIGFIPMARGHVVYHNRDITRKEIADILNTSLVRDRAFYAVMAQSGLRPVTICKLKIKHIEYERLLRGESPVKIDVPSEIAKGKYDHYFSFISSEAIKSLKSYLKTRAVNSESYLFVKSGTVNEPMNSVGFSAQFNRTVRKLRKKGVLNFELRDNKPSELRLYNIRKFFEKYAHKAGEEFSEFWMGHKVGVQDHYRATDPEHHRKLYAEKAAPDLRIETKTPRATEKQIEELRKELDETRKILDERDQQLKEMAPIVEKMKPLAEIVQDSNKEELETLGRILKGEYTLWSLDGKKVRIVANYPEEAFEQAAKIGTKAGLNEAEIRELSSRLGEIKLGDKIGGVMRRVDPEPLPLSVEKLENLIQIAADEDDTDLVKLLKRIRKEERK